jgi:hypothetical protein
MDLHQNSKERQMNNTIRMTLHEMGIEANLTNVNDIAEGLAIIKQNIDIKGLDVMIIRLLAERDKYKAQRDALGVWVGALETHVSIYNRALEWEAIDTEMQNAVIDYYDEIL